MRNLEFKARLEDPNGAIAKARELGFELWGDLRQTDTYFAVARGLLKLRETPTFPAELIFYQREEGADGRPSNYLIARSSDGASLAAVLAEALGVRANVRKRRTLFLLDTVRLHLDNVDGLGSFLEIEVPVDGDETEPRRQLEKLILALGYDWSDCVRGSYVDLISKDDGRGEA